MKEDTQHWREVTTTLIEETKLSNFKGKYNEEDEEKYTKLRV